MSNESIEEFCKTLNALIACLPKSPFKEALIDEVIEHGSLSRKQALEDAAKLHRWMLSEYDWVSSEQTKKESFDEFKVRMK